MGYKTKLLTILIPISITIVLFLTVEMIFRMYVPQDIYSEKQTIHQKRDENGNFVKPKTRTIYRCPEFDVSYEFDENGFRCSFKEYLNKSENDADKVKFLIIGDSFTFGAGNDYKSIWTSRLEEKLLNAEINVEIFNAGVPGYNTFAEVLLLEELVPKYQPDWVILTFLPNDMFSNISSMTSEEETVETVNHGSGSEFFFHSVRFIWQKLLNNDLLYAKTYFKTPRADFFRYPLSEEVEDRFLITKNLFNRASEFCSSNNARFAIVYIPQHVQVLYIANEFDIENMNMLWINDKFSRYAAENDILWLDTSDYLSQRYKENRQDLYFRYDRHLNSLGNQVIADFLFDSLKETISEQIL